MKNNTNISNNSEYLEYFRLVADAVAKYGIDEEQDLSKLIGSDAIKSICEKSFINKCTPNEAAVMIQLFLDRIYD